MSDHKVSGRRSAVVDQPRTVHRAAPSPAPSPTDSDGVPPTPPQAGTGNSAPDTARPAVAPTRRQLREQERSRPTMRHSTQRTVVRDAPTQPVAVQVPTARPAPAVPGPALRAASVRAAAKPAGKPRKFAKVAAPLAVAVTAASGLALTAFATPTAAPAPGIEASSTTEAAVVAAPPNTDFALDRSGLASSYDVETKLSEILVASGGAVTPAEAKGTLAQPLTSIKPTSGFGFRVDPLGRGQMMHTGQDFAIACGTDVFASAAGTVTESGPNSYHGNRVVVDHGNGLKTTYNHLSGVLVKAGEAVERGGLIAKSGSTGNSTGCHLHFEVVVNENFVDPVGWL